MNTDVLCQLKQLWQLVFQEPMNAIDSFFSTAYAPERCRYVSEKGQIVSALYWLDCQYEGGKLAYIYAVATHPDHRGKGLASQLLEQTHHQLQTLGYAGAVLKPAKGLFPFYQRLGYSTTGYIGHFTAKATASPAVLTQLNPEEYGQLRRTYLPPNAIIQEGATLDFLHTYANFYFAADALVCVARYEPVILEYLGNPQSAPGILAALNIAAAEIPTTGSDIPFAMFHPLNCTKAPGYLGLSLE